ncbi:MAG: precorrin-2 C(20)-methyltransferase [Firmicutes bacterium]|nr:precorrin-2 C(20)-methyltransferase [Bacillota bacterium]
MSGVLYGIGVGPGDPELMTLKAIKTLKEAHIIAAPGEKVEETLAFKIASKALPELINKELLPIPMPMVMDRDIIKENHVKGAELIKEKLGEGNKVAFITLGDPTIYSTFTYIEKLIKEMGFETVYISGIPSFCAAAAALGIPLAEWEEPLHILPGVHNPDKDLSEEGNYVIMKSGRKLAEIKEKLIDCSRDAHMIENCGMEDEQRYDSINKFPEKAGYFTLIISKENGRN